MYLNSGKSESTGATSPYSDLNGAPNLCKAVVEASSDISYTACCEMSSLFKSSSYQLISLSSCSSGNAHSQCSCFPVKIWPGGGNVSLVLRLVTLGLEGNDSPATEFGGFICGTVESEMFVCIEFTVFAIFTYTQLYNGQGKTKEREFQRDI